MDELQKIQKQIEQTRKELDELMLDDDYDASYQKSVYLDQLIEQYLDIVEGVDTK